MSAAWSHEAWLSRPTTHPIVVAVAAFYDVKLSEMTRPNRHARVARARMVAMFLLRQITKLSFPEIGRVLRRDHSTIIHGVQQVTQVWAADARLQADVAELCRRVGAAAPTPSTAPVPEAVGF